VRPPAQFAVLIVGFRLGRTAWLEFVAEHHVMRAVVVRTETIVLVKMLECAQEPRIVDAGGIIRFGFEKARECIGKALVFENHPAGNKIPVPGRFVVAQAIGS